MTVAKIAVEQLPLGIASLGLQLLDFRVDVSVAYKDVRPAVVVEIKEAAAPAQKLRVRTQACRESCVFKTSAAQIVVERGRVAGEVGLDQVEISVQIIVGGGNSHAGLRLAVGTQGAASLDGDVLKFPVLLVLIESAGRGIVGNINVGPAVVVEVGGEHSQTVGAVGTENSRSFGNVAERSVSVIVVENVLSSLQSGRAARHHHALIEARTRLGNGRSRQVEINVVGDEKIEAAVAIVIDKRATCVPARAFARHARLLADVGESSISVVVVENVLAVVGYEKIVPSVVVIVPDANALTPSRVRQSSLCGHIGERAIAIVPEQMRRRFGASGETFEARSVHQKYIEPSVVIVVVKGDAATRGLQQILILVLAAENGFYIQAGLASHVYEAHAEVVALWMLFRILGIALLAQPSSSSQPGRARQCQYAFERKHKSGPA